MDILASDFRSIIDDQKSEMGVPRDDRFRLSTNLFNVDDSGSNYPMDRPKNWFVSFLVVARSAA